MRESGSWIFEARGHLRSHVVLNLYTCYLEIQEPGTGEIHVPSASSASPASYYSLIPEPRDR